ncbi:hypothetical protein QUF70_06435 [Desulfobacterales bacterium HSG17]|nr:hypothetical protein [Desulfobacterales bacterium HSG17]
MLNKEIKQSYKDASIILQENKGELIGAMKIQKQGWFLYAAGMHPDIFQTDIFQKLPECLH